MLGAHTLMTAFKVTIIEDLYTYANAMQLNMLY